jgi:hypothetical protein
MARLKPDIKGHIEQGGNGKLDLQKDFNRSVENLAQKDGATSPTKAPPPTLGAAGST